MGVFLNGEAYFFFMASNKGSPALRWLIHRTTTLSPLVSWHERRDGWTAELISSGNFAVDSSLLCRARF